MPWNAREADVQLQPLFALVLNGGPRSTSGPGIFTPPLPPVGGPQTGVDDFGEDKAPSFGRDSNPRQSSRKTVLKIH